MSNKKKNTPRFVAQLILIPIALLILVGFVDSRRTDKRVVYAKPIIVTKPYHPEPQGDLYVFLGAVALRESNNHQRAVNRLGMLGKYQFSPRTLWSLGARFKVTRAQFLGNAELQDSAMVKYLIDNRSVLNDIIVKYDGQWYNGIYITESGLLAGAHLVGPHGLRAYFDTTYTVQKPDGRIIRPRTRDSNGTDVSEYIERFSGYDLHALGVAH